MRELVLRVPAAGVEDVLDRLLPLVPSGVREIATGDEVELRIRGLELPTVAEVKRTAWRWPHTIAEREVPDDWRERRVLDYERELIGGRLVVRPEWAPAAPAGLIDIALSDDLAFGAGTHPSTRAILALLLDVTPGGSFADLGCGSGVLAILAAKLGWGPVCAVDVQEGSVESARGNAARNGVSIDLAVADLMLAQPPACDGFAANMPATVHEVVAASPALAGARFGVISGFGPGQQKVVVAAYDQAGLHVRRQSDEHDWMVITLERA